MSDTLFKYLVPAVLLLIWAGFAYRRRDPHVTISTLYLMSTAAFAANWEFYFREIHQTIHVFVAVLGTLALRRRLPRFNIGLALFLAFIAVSVIAPGLKETTPALVNFLLIALVVNYLHAQCWSAPRMGSFLRFWAVCSTTLAILGLAEYVLLSTRIEGPFSNPNYYAFFVGAGYVSAFYTFKGGWRVFSLSAILIALVLSGSRAGIAFPVFQTAYYIWTSRHWGYKLVLSLVAIGFAGFLVMTGVSRFSDQVAVSGSDGERWALVQVAVAMADEHPFTGVGWGRFPEEFAEYAFFSDIIYLDHGSVDVTREDRRVTHNDFLRILAELGYPAAAFAALILVMCAMKFWRGKVVWPHVFVPLWAGSLLFSMTHNNMNSALFWLVMLTPFFGQFVPQMLKAPTHGPVGRHLMEPRPRLGETNELSR